MIAYTDGDKVRLVEDHREFRLILDAAMRANRIEGDLKTTRNWLIAVLLGLLSTWVGIAYVWAIQ